ncbi:TIGR04084 family radical SAM/SPASM domain-containing protein [Methanocella sp. MCL-LM]|uniref:TIGR04084 family radical SAM/SPASM domain-containing protein n=1 Tax=Methanocella sp. MCL-LM TaxID=3412035 RepID=UPI003C708331
MNYFITLTTGCDLECRYCYGECCDDFDDYDDGLDYDYFLPQTISYPTEVLKQFIAQDPDRTVIFYGGEPLLELPKMLELMDELPARRFLLHTNGTMLDRVPAEYLNRLHTISISIDGNRETTDFYRGSGVYDKITANARVTRSKGFTGEIIARMTVMEETDIYKQVMYLLDNQEFSFPGVHWQINALFWRNDRKKRNFPQWVADSYNPGITRLVWEWLRVMRDEGRVLKMYPFIGVMQSLLLGEHTQLRCGAGWAEYNVQTDGNLSPCPVMSGMKDFYAGHIAEGHDSIREIQISGRCAKCNIRGICGGRCLYANVTMKWGDDGFDEVCGTIRHLIGELQQALPEVRRLIAEGRIQMSDFEHMRYNSCEIIP